MGYNEKVVIIGAGISGLACAYRLRQMGIPSRVLEASARAGGVVTTIRRNGALFEMGPQCPRFPAALWGMVRELGLEGEFVAGDPKVKRYILRNGRLHLVPFSPGGLLRTDLLGLASKLRILGEIFGNSRPPQHEETLAEFVQRKFGVEVLENLVDPLVATIFFGDCYKMGMESAFPALVEWERRHGSLIRGAIGARKSKNSSTGANGSISGRAENVKHGSLRVTDALPTLGSFRSGMATLPEKIAESLKEGIRYSSEVSNLAPLRGGDGRSQGAWQVALRNGEAIVAANVVLALPAYAAGELLTTSVPGLAARLKEIEYAPMCAVSSVYERSQVTNSLDGFGYMAPRREGRITICTFWNSSLFPGRVPEGKVLMTTFARRSGAEAEEQAKTARAVEQENANT